jgi:ribonuclease HII
MILAGIDEAGYGPTLGPLVASATYFRLTAGRETCEAGAARDLWSLLDAAVCRKPDGRKVAVDDSKRLFSQKKGLRDLEEGLLPFLLLSGGTLPGDFRSLLAAVMGSEQAGAYLEGYPWYRGRNVSLPRATYPGAVAARARRLLEAAAAAGVEFLGMRARALEVLELNEALSREANKASVSFRSIALLLRGLWKRFPDEAVEVMVDRQGGRRFYGPALFKAVRPRSLRVEAQSEAASVYSLKRSQGTAPFQVSFAKSAESRSLPVALASMLSKYVREVHMCLFNGFWREHRADLKPTAGYHVDAHRFLEDIAPLCRELAVDDRMLVRSR